MLKDRISKLESERRALQERIDEIEEIPKKPDTSRPVEVFRIVEDTWDYLTFGEQRKVLRAAIDKIIVPKRGEDPTIVWNV